MKWLKTITTGFALFSMFFGSGNLVFPLLVGIESEGYPFIASLGIILTGVIIPFLGIYALKLSEGDCKKFFQPLGKIGTFCITLACLSLLGPFGVVARCIVVAHGACEILFPAISLPIISFFLCSLIYFFCMNEQKLVSRLGAWLTPFLLVSMASIILFGLNQTSASSKILTNNGSFNALLSGFRYGYQTMDLMAAFFFASFILVKLKNPPCAEKNLFIQASMIGGALLALVYLGLVYLGWQHKDLLIGLEPQEMLGQIALVSLGKMAGPCVCIAIILACLTTAIILTFLFANFIKQELFDDRLNTSQSLLITLTLAFLISTLNFAGISRFLSPILEFIYPFMIAYTLLHIIVVIAKKSTLQNLKE